MELYDLTADPAESLNVAGGSPGAGAQQHLAAWARYQHEFFKGLLVPQAR